MGRQFTAPRLIGLGILSAAMLTFIIWMTNTYPAEGGNSITKDDWVQFRWLAVVCIGIVVVTDVLVTVTTFRRSKRLQTEDPEELDPEGAHPELTASMKDDGQILDPIVKNFINKEEAARDDAVTRKPFMQRIRDYLPTSLSLQAVPLQVVLISMLCSGILIYGAIVYGFPLWGIVLAGMFPWIPVFTFEAVWKYKHYGFYTFMLVFTILQIGHLGEHSAQVGQLLWSKGDLSVAHGVFGALDRELVHFVWDSLVWIGICVLLIKLGPHNKWLWISFIAASFHEVEHLFLFYLDRFETPFYDAGGTTGILAKGGLIGTPFDRPYLHYIYNFFVVIPLVMAMWDETKRAYNIYVAKALPSLTRQEKVAVTQQLDRKKFQPGETIVREGEVADAFYLLADGEAEVLRATGNGDEVIGTMGPGQFF